MKGGEGRAPVFGELGVAAEGRGGGGFGSGEVDGSGVVAGGAESVFNIVQRMTGVLEVRSLRPLMSASGARRRGGRWRRRCVDERASVGLGLGLEVVGMDLRGRFEIDAADDADDFQEVGGGPGAGLRG